MDDRPLSEAGLLKSAARPADADAGSWVYRSAPLAWRPYLKLARMDRPVGVWLLLWPCLWSLLFHSPGLTLQTLWFALLFAIGALVMRGAGCTYNDIVDRDIDAQVTRTALRPIPAGEVSARQAFGFAVALSLTGFVVLTQFNMVAIAVGASSLVLVAIYPFMKRITYWPQAWLGLTFNWGVLVASAATQSTITTEAIILYLGCIAWTLGYDTVYAHQDKEDDALIGVKSTALALGRQTRVWLAVFYATFWLGLVVAGWLANLGPFYYTGAVYVAVHMGLQVARLDMADSASCLAVFKSNITLGWGLFAGLLADRLISAYL